MTDVNGVEMFYRTTGQGDPILLVHGLGGDIRSWEFQENALAEHFTLIMPDQRGHGHSGGPDADTVSTEDFANDLATLLDKLNYDSLHVVGHSMGGMIAQQFALDHPEYVEKLVLIDTAPRITEATIDEVYSWREAQVEGGAEAYQEASVRSTFPREFIQNNPNLIDYLMSRENLVNQEGVLAAGLGMASFDITDRLSEIDAETLIIHGEEDAIMGLSLAKVMHERFPDSHIITFADCGHSPPVQCQDELNQIIIKFLSS